MKIKEMITEIHDELENSNILKELSDIVDNIGKSAAQTLLKKYGCKHKPIKPKFKRKIIAIEGTDGSGKATQAKLLYYKYRSLGIPCKLLSFPMYEKESSFFVREFLKGKYKNLHWIQIAQLYALDRYANKEELDFDGVIICDRYTPSNIIYQSSRENELPVMTKFNTIEFMEDGYGIPKPDKTIYLDVPIEVSQELMHKRYNGDENKKDVNEKNLEFLKKCRENALLISQYTNWDVIDCTKDNQILSIEEIFEKVKNCLNLK